MSHLIATACALLTFASSVGAAATEPLTVSHAGGVWTIEARAASRLDVAKALAASSKSTLEGHGGAMLAETRPLTLRWRGTSAHAAWQAVLEGAVHHAVQCAPRQCRVWVVGLVAPAAASPARDGQSHGKSLGAQVAPARSASPVFELEPPAAAPATPPHLEPDPPGLFPAQ